MSEQKMIPQREAVQDVRLMARRTALLYYHFAKTLVDELGDEEGQRLIAKAVWAYGEHCGAAVRKGVEALGLPATSENYNKVADLPRLGWETASVTTDSGETHPIATFCPLAAAWQEIGPEAAKLGRMYCFVDQAKYHAYNRDYVYEHAHNVLNGDDYCEFVVRRALTPE